MSAPLYFKEIDPIKVSIESNKYYAAKNYQYVPKEKTDDSFEVNTGFSFSGEWQPYNPVGTVTF